MVEKILVDQDARKVTCYIRQLPGVGPFEEGKKNAQNFLGAESSPNGNRTRISALRGLRPKPLDDGAGYCLSVFSISILKIREIFQIIKSR